MKPDITRRAVLAGLSALALPAQAKPRSNAPYVDDGVGIAQDETFWREIQSAFTLDRTVINLNNGGCSPTPRVVHEAFKRYLDWSNQGPPHYMWGEVEQGVEAVRRELAREAGCDPETLAITRNASEALQIVQLGLDLQPGDEVLTTDQDYPRMLTTWAQRVKRDGIALRRVSLPTPGGATALASRLLNAINHKTKVLHISHIINVSGQIMPVAAICAEARARGVFCLVDGAHAFGQWPFRLDELGCDAYGTSLHKWLLAPVGTGFLHVRQERIPEIWPLQPAPLSMVANIRKYEEIGTHPAANHDAIAEALVFHRGIGGAVKAARLRYLRKRWTDAVRNHPKVQLHTSDDPALSCAIGTVGIAGKDPADLVRALWDHWRIIATPITVAPVDPTNPDAVPEPVQYAGVRVTPNIYTTLDEVDRFAEALLSLAA